MGLNGLHIWDGLACGCGRNNVVLVVLGRLVVAVVASELFGQPGNMSGMEGLRQRQPSCPPPGPIPQLPTVPLFQPLQPKLVLS